MRRRLIFALCLLGIALLYGWRLGARSLWEPDEPRYAEIAREMIVSGDWIEPRLDFLKYYEKPPLTYWITALSFSAFGISETTARLGPVLAALALLSGTWLLGRRLYDEWTANLGTLAFALSLYAWITGRLLLTDIFLAAGVIWAVAGYVMAAEEGTKARSPSKGMAVAGAALAVAWMAKGPVGLVIPLLGIVPHAWLGRKEVRVGARGWLLAGGVFALLGVPWFVAICVRDPSFAEFFFYHEHVLRYLTPEARRPQSWYFYLLVLLVGLFPISVLIPWGSYRAWPGLRPRTREGRGSLLLTGLGFLTLLFFTLSHSKLATYVLPAAPAFALLTARGLRLAMGSGDGAPREGERSPELAPGLDVPLASRGPRVLLPRGLRASLAIAAALCVAGAAAAGWQAVRPAPPLERGLDLVTGAALLGLLAAALTVAAWHGSRRALSKTLWPIAGLCAVTLLFAEQILERLDPFQSDKQAALFVRAHAGPDDFIASYGMLLHGLTFYTERRTAVIGGAGELTFGARGGAHEGWVIPRDRLPEILETRKVYVVSSTKLEQRALRDSEGRLSVELRSPSYSVLANHE